MNVGSDVVAIGSPGSPGGSQLLVNTVTKGLVSAFRKWEVYGLLVQADCHFPSIRAPTPTTSAIAPHRNIFRAQAY